MARQINDPLTRQAEPAGRPYDREPDLFDLLPAAAPSPQQQAAAAAAKAEGTYQAKILELLRAHGPQTCFELARRLQVTDNRISGRLTNMARSGLIERTGEHRRNPETGVNADVWRPIPEGDADIRLFMD